MNWEPRLNFPSLRRYQRSKNGESHSSNETAKSKNTCKLTHDFIKQDCRILLVEDGIYNQRLINFLLKKAGAEVTIVENGRLAIDELLKSQAIGDPLGDQYDLILMDIQMPLLDGYATTRKLRSMGFPKPIIALTAHAMHSDRKKCFDAGCDEYLTKPIDRNKLISVINSIMKTETQKILVTK